MGAFDGSALSEALVALATGAYAYLVYSPKPHMPSLSSDVQHAKRSYLAYVPASLPSGAALVSSCTARTWTGRRRGRGPATNSIKWPISKASLCSTLTAISTTGTTVGRMRRSQRRCRTSTSVGRLRGESRKSALAPLLAERRNDACYKSPFPFHRRRTEYRLACAMRCGTR